jgi:hypothetical protein
VEDAGKRDQDLLIAIFFTAGRQPSSRGFLFQSIKEFRGISMLRTNVCLAAMLLVLASWDAASAQTAAPAATAPAAAKTSRVKLTAAKLKDMKAKWSANKGKLAVCRKEVKSKGLAGDDRWFYIEDCMGKT